MDKKVSIIMPSFNRESLIGETLDSVVAQTYENWECIIIDDGSTDCTIEVVKSYVENDVRFKLLTRPKNTIKGPSACRNHGIEHATGDYFLFFDDDDIAHPQNLELCVFELSNEAVSFCRYLRDVFFGKFNVKFDYSKTYTKFNIDSRDIERILKNELFCITSCIMWKRECFKKHRFVEDISYGEEWELYSRIIFDGYKGISINKCLFYGRKHTNQITNVYYGDNEISKRSYATGIVLVVKNLKKKELLSDSILSYFVKMAIDFKEYNLFEEMMDGTGLKKQKRIKWLLLYKLFPIKYFCYKKWMQLKKR